MDRWKYFAATHSDHVFCNPLSEAKVDELIELLRLPPGARVLDVACGKGELLCRTATRWKASGVGVDLSPFEVQNANANGTAKINPTIIPTTIILILLATIPTIFLVLYGHKDFVNFKGKLEINRI